MKKTIILLGILLLSSSLIQAQADCKETPPGGLSELAAFSLFSSNYSNGDYEFALRYGRWMHCAKPETLEGYAKFDLEKQYNKLIRVYSEVGKTKADPAVRSAYIDTVLILFNESIEMFGDNEESLYDIHLNKGRFYQQNYSMIENGLDKAYAEYQKLFELDTEKSLNLGNGYYLRIVLTNLVDEGKKEEAQALIDSVKPLAEGEILAYIEEQQQELLGSPEEVIAYFQPLVEKEPENMEAWKALEAAYSELGNREKLKEVRLKIHELNPTYESALNLAELQESNANYSQAAKYYKEALGKAETDEQRKDLYLNLADASISQADLPQAKKYVNEAIDLDPNFGLAYIKMATIYGQAVTQCTEDRKLEAKDRVVYWAVLDYLNKAKNVDPSVSNTVNRQLSTYEAVTPTAEDRFLTLGYEEGQKVQIDGSLMPCYSWINETVTVR